jgi:transcriptional regulator with XRE-family HTH domain
MRPDFVDEFRRLAKFKFKNPSQMAKAMGMAHTTAMQYWGRRHGRFPHPEQMEVQTLERISDALNVPTSHWFGKPSDQSRPGKDAWGRLIVQFRDLQLEELPVVVYLIEILRGPCQKTRDTIVYLIHALAKKPSKHIK